MRNKLRALRNKKRPTFSAKFKKYGIKKDHYGNYKQTALLIEVKYKGKVVADHLWFEVSSSFRKMSFKENDYIQFQATVFGYLRGYVGTKLANQKTKIELDYGLIELSNFQKIT